MTWRRWLSFAVFSLTAPLAVRPAAAQLAPTGGHYANQPSDTGFTGGVNSSGGYSASIPLDLPGARGGLPVPVSVVYGGGGVGAAGLGWDVPLSYIRRDNTIAHRRPKQASASSPQWAREQVSLVLEGRAMELVQTGSEWVARRDAPELVVREQSDGTWVAYDGQGRTYLFAVVDPALNGADLWLLKTITGTGGSRVQLDYTITSPTVGTIAGIAIDLTRVSYNPHPTMANCYKNTVVLHYDGPAATPLSISVLGDRLLVRMHKLDGLNVTSKETCGGSEVVLRGYQLQHEADGDTQLPRLHSVHVVGRDGTPENGTPLPIATYSYGTATSSGSLQYQLLSAVAAPGFGEPYTVNGGQPIPPFGVPFGTYGGLLDLTGDGLPETIVSDFIERGLTIIPDWLHSYSEQNLLGSVLLRGPHEIHSLSQERYKKPPSADLVWRQAIDVNGDGRLDIVDAATEIGHWVVYLNVPDLTIDSTVRWARRSYSTQALETYLTARGLHVDAGRVPLARRWTAEETVTKYCWTWPAGGIEWTVTDCGTTTSQHTFTEWETNDINGDGYPDLVMNSSPVISVTQAPPPPPTPPEDPTVRHNVTRTVRVTPTLAATNEIDAVFNVLGVHIDLDSQPFSPPVLLAANDKCGVAQWNEADSTHQALQCGIVDVNGDGLADRVSARAVRLGTGTFGTNGFFTTSTVLSLPGSLAVQENDLVAACTTAGSGAIGFTTHLTAGLHDLTGDGIPDYVWQGATGQWSAAIGTGTGFLSSIPINGVFALSSQVDRCDGFISATTTGLYDVDGDGKPDVVTSDPDASGNSALVYKLVASGGVLGAPEAGRLVQVDNGFGAITNITYRSAKLLLDPNSSARAATSIHQVPFPEIVVSSVQTTLPRGPQNQNRNLAPVQYAYGGAELVFDPVADRFTFPGYRRRVALSVPLEDQNGTATITDIYEPANPADPYDLGTTSLTPAQRYARDLRIGRVSDVSVLSGNVGTDPSALLAVNVTTDERRIATTHDEYDAKLLPDASNAPEACNEMVYPYDYKRSREVSKEEDINACRQRGFAFATSVQSFRGAPGAAPGADASVTTRSEVKTIDDFGRVTSAKQLGDTTRTDDDLCIETEYANATGQNERVLSAAAKRSVTDCGTTIYAKDTWEYDKLAVGSVSAGLPTAHTVERRDDTGKLLGEVLREFDATFDAAGNPEKMTTSRDGATRTATVEYDPFKLVPVKLKTEASGVPTMQISLTRHPLTLSVTTSQDLNETTRGTTFDGFDRLVLTTVTPPGGTEGALSCTTYRGFDGSDSQGRSVTSKVFTDVVAPATACTATGRTATVHLDELGRARVTEQVLGTSYPNVTMKVDQTYDSLGRLVFATDPYPSNQNAATAYGTTQYFNADGTPLCTIRGKGKQPRPQPQSQPTDPPTPMVTDEANEVYPTCFSRSFREHLEVFSVRDAASLLPNSPQDGVVKYSYFTPMGRLTARTTWKGSTRLEYATFTQDPLGHLASMERSQTATSADTVKSSWHTDSLGQVVELDEPDSPAQFNVYSNWGELIETKRTVNGSVKRVVQKYDALGRVIHSEQQTGGVVDPETVHDYAYDTAVQVSPHVTATNVLGRLAQATWPTGSVTYSYDGLGRNNAQVFTDAQGGNYVEKHTFHGDGSLDVLDLFLPDTAYADEQIKYTYDSAGRGRNVTYTNGTSQDLYHASTIDPFGRVREAKYGPATYTADYADVGRRLMRSVAVASPPKARSISYSGFDPLGRERSRTEIKDGTGSGATTTWAYDALGRLSSAVQTGGTTNFNQQFTYDQIGNLLTVTNTGTDATNTALTYSTTDRDRICHIAFGNDTNTACNVTYDELGSILSQPTPNGSREYTYLVDGSVRKITDDRGSIANFRYDAFGQVQELDLTSNTSTDEREDHHFGSLITLRKEKPNGASGSSPILTRKIPLHDGSVATRHGSGGPWTFEYGEPRGNRFFTDETGAFVQDVDYQPFGKPTSTGAQPGSQLYSNKQWNGGDALAAFGISKLGARLYDPAIGRFLSRDPLLIPRTAATTNPYAFAMNDPVNLSDPSGLQAVEPLGQPFIVKKYERGPTGGNPLQPTPDVTADSDVAEGTFVFNPEIPWEDRDPFANAQGPDTQRGSSHSDTPSTVQEAIRKTSAPARAVMAMMYPMFRTDGVAAAADRFARGVAADVVMVGGTTAGGIVGGAAGPAGAVLGAALGAGIAYPFAEWIRGETPTLSGQLTASAFGATFEVGGRVAGNLFSRLLTAALSRACFAAGTLVTTSRGALPIEEVHSGDYVWSRDEKTGVEAWMPVVRTFVTPDKPVLALTLSDTDGNQEQLSVTSEHPFWTQDGWKRAGDLHGGDRVLALSGWTEVLLVIDTGRNETVYNLEVAEFHTYFAGHIGFWVHNDCVAVARAISRSLASAGCKFECFKHAEDLISALRGKGIQGIELTLDVGDKWVYSNTHGALGVQGAVHKAVQVGDFVFDNMHPSGIRYSDWIRDFGGPVFTRSPHAELLTKSF